MSKYTPLTRHGDTGYTFCGCVIDHTEGLLWSVSRNGAKVGVAHTLAEAKEIALNARAAEGAA